MKIYRGFTLLVLAAVCMAAPAWSQEKGKTIQGKVVKVQAADNLLVLRTIDGQDVRILLDQRTTLRWQDRPVLITDLAAGHQVSIVYELGNDRLLAHAITVTGPAELAPAVIVKGIVVRSEPNLLVIRDADGKELAIGMTPETAIRLGSREVRLVNLTPGQEVTVAYQTRVVAVSISVPAATVPAEPTILRGKIVKVLGTENAFILSTAEGKEIRLLVDDRSVLRLKDQQAKLVDFRENMIVAVGYTQRGDQYVVTTLDPQAAVIAAPAIVGKIRGQVLEADRPQPDLEVNLTVDDRIVATVRTLPNGTFEFEKVPPGTYTVSAVKSSSKTQGATRLTVQGNTVATAVINLLR